MAGQEKRGPGRPKKKSNAGRKSVMTESVVKKLEEAFLMGCNDSEACLFAQITRQTLHNFQKKNPDFIDRKTLLKENPTFQARRTVMTGIQYDPDLAFKFLSKKKPEEFSEKQILRHEGSEKAPLINIHIVKPEPVKDAG